MLEPQDTATTALFRRATNDNPACGSDAFRRTIRTVRNFRDDASARIGEAIDTGQVSLDQRQNWEDAREIAVRLEAASR